MDLKELDGVRVAKDIPELRLKKGMIGTIVHIHKAPQLAYMVEFSDHLGRTNAMPTLLPEQVEKDNSSHEEYEAREMPFDPDNSLCVDPNS